MDFALANNADPDEMPPYGVVWGCVIPGHAHFHFSLNFLNSKIEERCGSVLWSQQKYGAWIKLAIPGSAVGLSTYCATGPGGNFVWG